MLEAGAVDRKVGGVERVHARRVDPHETGAVAGEKADQLRRQRREILAEGLRVGRGAGGEQHARRERRPAQRVRQDDPSRPGAHADELAAADVEVEVLLVDRSRAPAVVARRVGVRAEVNRGAERGHRRRLPRPELGDDLAR